MRKSGENTATFRKNVDFCNFKNSTSNYTSIFYARMFGYSSKLWVLGSNPNGITNKTKRKKHHLSNHLVLFSFYSIENL